MSLSSDLLRVKLKLLFTSCHIHTVPFFLSGSWKRIVINGPLITMCHLMDTVECNPILERTLRNCPVNEEYKESMSADVNGNTTAKAVCYTFSTNLSQNRRIGSALNQSAMWPGYQT